jgi:2-polyprenyl-3-methyl-5-hydroxy-6-metoxy-1,4-benzoquinol methylase
MRVLDVGSGTGAVAFITAELVGPSGEVVGTDLAPAAVVTANEAAKARALGQVSFREGNPTEMTFGRPFDAIVGRYVLMFQADAGEMLRRLAKQLRPGGIIVFHEPDWSFVRSDPVAPTYDRCCRWISQAFDRANTSAHMSAKLHRAFVTAGLPSPTMRMQTVIGDAHSAEAWLRSVADLAIVLASAMERQGVATSAEIGSDTLADRIVQEVADGGGIVVGRAEIGAWVRVPLLPRGKSRA